MDSGAYWYERAEQRVLMGDKSAAELAQTMRTLYDRALADINKEIEAFYGRYAAQNGLTLADVKKRLNPAELKSARQHLREYYDRVDEVARVNGHVDPALLRQYKAELRELSAKSYVSRLEELKANLQNITFNLGVKENEAFYQTLSDLFSEGYFHNIYDVQRFLGGYAGWDISLNPRILESALREKWLGMNFSERIWTNKGKLLNELETTFLSGVARGLNPREIAKTMAKNCGASYYACERLARTESANIIETATAKSYAEYGIKKYQFLATFDRRVCENCGSMDSKIFNLKDKAVGINYPPLHPNCRCSTIPYFPIDDIEELYGLPEKLVRDENNKWIKIPMNMGYDEWKKKYVKPLQKS